MREYICLLKKSSSLQAISRHVRELLRMEEPLWSRSITLPPRDERGSHLEKMSRSNKVSCNLLQGSGRSGFDKKREISGLGHLQCINKAWKCADLYIFPPAFDLADSTVQKVCT